MTILLYQTDSYIKEFDSSIVALDDSARAVALAQSAFYPGGGGQPCDFGALTVGGLTYPVTQVKKQGSDILHFLGGEDPLPPLGALAHGQLDWPRRYRLMRTHTALHILCGCVFRDYGALVTGGNMDPLEGRLDFEFPQLKAEMVGDIEAAINREVESARPLQVQILPREVAFQIPDLIRTKINLLPEGISEIRTVEIVGLDLQADGGTHVHNSAEVGKITISDYKSKGSINKRIYITLTEES